MPVENAVVCCVISVWYALVTMTKPCNEVDTCLLYIFCKFHYFISCSRWDMAVRGQTVGRTAWRPAGRHFVDLWPWRYRPKVMKLAHNGDPRRAHTCTKFRVSSSYRSRDRRGGRISPPPPSSARNSQTPSSARVNSCCVANQQTVDTLHITLTRMRRYTTFQYKM